MRPVFFVVLDGLSDEPIPDLGDRTPLDAASTPNLDALAAEGALGTCTTVGEGIAPESDIAVMALLGYDPSTEHPGRGPVEALGSGVDVRDGDLAWRCNLATVDEWPHLVDRRVGRDIDAAEAEELARLVNEEVELGDADFVFRPTVGHRGVLRIRDRRGALSAEVGNTDPAYERRGSLGVALEDHPWEVEEAVAVEDSDAARRGAELTNRFTRAVFDVLDGAQVNRRRRERGRLAANAILSRDAGDHLPELRPVGERFDARFGCFVEMPVEAGIAELTGMEPVPVGDQSDDPDERYRTWADLAVEAADSNDVLYIHLKGPDIPAHDGRWDDKVGIIEAIDRSFFGHLDRGPGVLLVTADHTTSCLRAAHTDQPVPVLAVGPGIDRDAADTFSEAEAREGSLGHRNGTELMPWIIDVSRR